MNLDEGAASALLLPLSFSKTKNKGEAIVLRLTTFIMSYVGVYIQL